MYDWLIIGGGIHGAHLAIRLLSDAAVRPERLGILDPHEQLLARWENCTRATGMRFLRSTVVHHLASDPHDLWHYARRRGLQPGMFRGPYKRPALNLFRDHCQTQITAYNLDQRHVRGRASELRRSAGGWWVETDQGSLTTQNVLLALSVSEQPRRPAWAIALGDSGAAIRHLYDAGFQPKPAPGTVVIGGGISAVQAAVALARALPGSVTLLMRHDLRIAGFDSPPSWVGPKELRGFLAEPRMSARRTLIAGARLPGTVPHDVAHSLRRAEKAGLLRVMQGEVSTAERSEAGAIRLHCIGGSVLEAGQVILATGFAQQRPGGPWLDAAIDAYDLPLAPCGYPLVDRGLCWTPGLYATGALAELELGPAARNIVGARHAGERLVGGRDMQ